MTRSRLRPVLAFLGRAAVASLLFLAATVRASSAQPFGWPLPAGGETWTAGTTHTVEWSGGNPSWSVNVRIIRLSPFAVADIVATGVPNSGAASWTIPGGFPAGLYQAYVEDSPLTTWAYSQTFTVQQRAACPTGCSETTASMPFFNPPAGACGSTPAQADSAARAYVLSHLICQAGFALDPGSITIDVTFLPVGVCLAGYSGAYVAEASAVACCCSLPVPVQSTTWGRIKAIRN